MPRSSAPKGKRGGGGKGAGSGGRLLTVGLFLVLVLVAVLIGSLVAGLRGRGAPRAPNAPSAEPRDDPSMAAAAPARRVRVEVLNASGTPGLASDGRRVLRDRGFDVVAIGNAPREFGPDSTVIVDRVGKIELAREVADSLRVRRVVAKPDSNLYLDVTVVLGKDWAAPGAEQPAAP